MKEIIVGTLIFLVLFLIPFIGGVIVSELRFNNKLDQCAKQRNVYACEYVAVPKKDGAE